MVGGTDTTVPQGTDDVRNIARAHRVLSGRRPCQHLNTYRPCRACRRGTIAWQDQLERLAPVHGTDSRPATFGLEQDELRAEANRLAASGWAVDEVQQVLAVERRAS